MAQSIHETDYLPDESLLGKGWMIARTVSLEAFIRVRSDASQRIESKR
jgi:hypothetical protein